MSDAQSLALPTTPDDQSAWHAFRRKVASLMLAVSILYLYSNVGFFININLGFPLKVSHYFVLVGLVGAAFLLTGIPKPTLSFHAMPLVLFGGFIAYVSAQILFAPYLYQNVQIYISYVECFICFGAFLILLLEVRDLRLFQVLLSLVLLVSAVVNIIEFLMPSRIGLSSVAHRAAGLYLNSNQSALVMCLALPLSVLNRSFLFRLASYFVCAAGVFVTFSRSGYLLLLLAIIMVEWSGLRVNRYRIVIFLGIGMTFIVMLFYATLSSADISADIFSALDPYLDANTKNRVLFNLDDSSAERLYLLELGYKYFKEAPIFGQGIGYTRVWEYPLSVHNMYVLMAVEHGLIGVTWFVSYLYSLRKPGSRCGIILLGMLAFASFFTHNMLEQPSIALIIALYLEAARREIRNSGDADREQRTPMDGGPNRPPEFRPYAIGNVGPLLRRNGPS